MAEEAAQLTGQGAEYAAARELQARRREAARLEQLAAAEEVEALEEESAELESFAEEEAAGRALRAKTRAAGRGGEAGSPQQAAGAAIEEAGEVIDLVTAVVEFETIVVPLALLGRYHVRFLGGNLGVLPEFLKPADLFLEKTMEVASAGAKSAGKAGGAAAKGTAGAGGAAAKSTDGMAGAPAAKQPSAAPGVGEEGPGGLKSISVWQIAVMIIVDVLLIQVVVVSFLIMAAVPAIILGVGLGAIAGVCAALGDACSWIIEQLGSFI